MRTRSLTLLILMSLLLSSTSAYAQQRRGRRTKSQARKSTANQQTVLSQADRSQTVGSQVTAGEVGGDEQQVMARVRGYQLLMEREQKILSQRMTHAGQLRQQGLQNKDQRLLDQAEQYERNAIAAYRGQIQQFEKTDLNSKASGKVPQRAKDSKAFQGNQPTTKSQARRRSSQTRYKSATSGTPRSAKSMLDWLR